MHAFDKCQQEWPSSSLLAWRRSPSVPYTCVCQKRDKLCLFVSRQEAPAFGSPARERAGRQGSHRRRHDYGTQTVGLRDHFWPHAAAVLLNDPVANDLVSLRVVLAV